ncbi:MAG: GNAT family N-acetyltransferase [Treponema sp.]
MTYNIIRTDGTNKDFIELCRMLDENLDEIVGKKFQRSQYAPYNTLENIHHVLIAYDGTKAIAGGSFKEYDKENAELKRVFVQKEYQRQGIAKNLVLSLERWAVSCGYSQMILETGEPLTAAMSLYRNLGYSVIPNYGQYRDMKNSICMEKKLYPPAFVSSGDGRLDKQLEFIAEIDKMTHILRHTLHIDGSGRENDAEHSWHLGVMAMLLGEYADDRTDINRAIKMVLVHDLVEIYAGDTFAYDKAGYTTKVQREKESADRLFSQLPEDQGKAIRSLWEEFDAGQTADARFAACMDRIQPFLHNTLTNGTTWQEGHVRKCDVLIHMAPIKTYMPRLWPWIEANIDNAFENGWLKI